MKKSSSSILLGNANINPNSKELKSFKNNDTNINNINKLNILKKSLTNTSIEMNNINNNSQSKIQSIDFELFSKEKNSTFKFNEKGNLFFSYKNCNVKFNVLY